MTSDALPTPVLLSALLSITNRLHALQDKLAHLSSPVSAKEHRHLLEARSILQRKLTAHERLLKAAEALSLDDCSPEQLTRVIHGLLDQTDGPTQVELALQLQRLLTWHILLAIQHAQKHDPGKASLSLAVGIVSCVAASATDPAIPVMALKALQAPSVRRLAKTLSKLLPAAQCKVLLAAWTGPSTLAEAHAKGDFSLPKASVSDGVIEYWIMSQPWMTDASLLTTSQTIDSKTTDQNAKNAPAKGATSAEPSSWPSAPEPSDYASHRAEEYLDLPAVPDNALAWRTSLFQEDEMDDEVAQELEAQRLIQRYTGKFDADRFDRATRETAWSSDPETSEDASAEEEEEENSTSEAEDAEDDESTRLAVATLMAEAHAELESERDATAMDQSLDNLIREAEEAMAQASAQDVDEDGKGNVT